MIDRTTNYIKIGKSKNIFYREKTLQAERPTIEGLFYVEDDIEKLLHSLFSEKRLRGEWFNLNQENIDFIDQIISQKGLIKKGFSLNNEIQIAKNKGKTPITERQENNDKAIALITKSNSLVESRYKFDIWETRIFLCILAQIHQSETNLRTYRIWYKDVIKTFGLNSGDAYASLRNAAKNLIWKPIRTNYCINGVNGEQEVSLITQIDSMTEGKKNSINHEYIDVQIQNNMKPFLLQLQRNFTAYDIQNVVKLGVYSIRMYELLKQYESIGSRALTIDEMKRMFELNHEYQKYNDFYRWVIKSSEQEINRYTDILILNIEKLKEGRKITALRFIFRKKTV